MTKVTILGEQTQETKKKQIEFIKQITELGEWRDASSRPSAWDNIDLIKPNWRNSGYDLMIFYDTISLKNNGGLALGHFNDGVVE